MAGRKLIAIFATVTLAPAVTMLWLGSRLLQQDGRLEAQYRQERREQASDRAVRSLHVILAEAALFQTAPAAGAILVRYPRGPKLFHTEPAILPEAPAHNFREGEELENERRDPRRATEIYRALTDAKDPAVRAGAWLRLARTLRKERRLADALAAYGHLALFENVAAAGWPATLAAAWGRSSVLEDLHRNGELRESAGWLQLNLNAGRWTLSRAAYDAFAEDAERWTGEKRPREAELLTEASNALWERVGRGEEAAEGRRLMSMNGQPVTLLWKPLRDGTAVVAASNSFVEKFWLRQTGESVWLRDETGRDLQAARSADFVLRYPAETKLPWIVAVAAPTGSDGFIARRQMLLLLLALVALFTLAGGYFCLHTLRREFALARMQSDFVSAVSHEFRTPLTSMQLISEALVDERIPDPGRLRDSYLSLARATQRLHRLVEDLLDFRRMESGAIEFRMRSLDATQTVRTVAEEFRKEVEERGFRVRVSLDDGARIKADESALGRALWNLLDNAAKYSGTSRDIDVSLERDGARVRISVADGGIGIAPEERTRVFTKFYRGAEAKRSEIPGTGIGLAMVAQITAAHGGKVSVTSEIGQGSTFTMWLPVEET